MSDLISRQDAIEAVENNSYGMGSRASIKAIKALPSAEAVHGKWIFEPKDAIDLMFAKPKCSKCGFESSDGGNFCPNCGVRMLGEDGEA